MAFCKSLSRSKMHFNGNLMSRGVKMDVCGLDHSGSQPFNYYHWSTYEYNLMKMNKTRDIICLLYLSISHK